jgi:hypothetical protein
MSEFKFDEDFDYFLTKFGQPFASTPIGEKVVAAYRYKLPQQLLDYWRALGACGFGDGALWMVNPAEHQDQLDSWLQGSPFEKRDDLSVFVRTAFGEYYVWGKGKGVVLTINPCTNLICHWTENDSKQLTPADEDKKMRYFFGATNWAGIDRTDEQEKPLFARAFKKLGRLKSDEVYGFKHRFALGGKELLSNLDIMKLDVYHDIAQQMEPPEIIQI